MSPSHAPSQNLPETVLITGASSGIGQELAHCFAEDGSECVLLARSEEALHDLSDTLASAHGVNAHVLRADLSVPGVADDIDATLQERGFSVDVLVNNAGSWKSKNNHRDVVHRVANWRANV